MKRILHVIGKMDRAGAETMLMNLYRNIDRSQIQFDFITFTKEVGDYDAEIIEMGGKIIPILASNPVYRMLELAQFLKQNQEYKIVHAHTLLSNAFHLIAAKKAGVKHRISHSHSTSNGHSSFVKKIYEKWALITNRQVATYKIACGKLAAEYLFGTKDNVLLLPNAVDISEMTGIAECSRDYMKHQFKDDGLKLIQVGRLNEIKNHKFSLKIAKELKKRKIEFTLYLVGQGPLESKLKQQVEESLLSHNVKFLGVRNDIAQLMAGADFMIMPSLHEGFPVVLVESQTVGLTAIVSNQVSKEVDLGLGSVDFLPINFVEGWVDRILKPKIISVSDINIAEVLKNQGFDVAENANQLTEIYNTFD